MRNKRMWVITGSLAGAALITAGAAFVQDNQTFTREGGPAVVISDGVKPANTSVVPTAPASVTQPSAEGPNRAAQKPTSVAPKVYTGSGSSVPSADSP